MLRGACVDLYSTVVHEAKDNPFYRNVAAELSLDLTRWLPAYRDLLDESISGRLPGMTERVLKSARHAGCTVSAAVARGAVERHFPEFLASVRLDPQAGEFLASLRKLGLRLALVSNASSYSEAVLDSLDLRRRFDVVVLSYMVGMTKPDPAIYRHALRLLDLPGRECTFIGDGEHDELRGAREAGITTMLVDRGLRHSQGARGHADVVVDDLLQAAQAAERLRQAGQPAGQAGRIAPGSLPERKETKGREA